MKKNSSRMFALTLFGLVTLAAMAVSQAATTYKFLKEIPVSGEGGGWDYLSVDEAGRRLFVSHGTRVVVIDLDKEAVVGEIANTPGVHGVAVAHELGRAFTSNGQENKSSMVDLKTLETLSRIETGKNPDGMLYEPGEQEIYMFNGRSESATVIDAKSEKVVTTIALGGKPEFCVADAKAGRVYNNLEDKSEVVAIDTKKHEVVNRWPLAPKGEEPSGLAIDIAHHRLFVGCGNGKMVMMDSASGKVVADVPIGRGVDANAFDPGTQLEFASCGDGTVTIAHEDSPDKLTVVQTLKTEPRAKTMTLDPKTHKIYLASAKFEAAAPGAEGGGRKRPPMVPGSFKVLVYGMDE